MPGPLGLPRLSLLTAVLGWNGRQATTHSGFGSVNSVQCPDSRLVSEVTGAIRKVPAN